MQPGCPGAFLRAACSWIARGAKHIHSEWSALHSVLWSGPALAELWPGGRFKVASVAERDWWPGASVDNGRASSFPSDIFSHEIYFSDRVPTYFIRKPHSRGSSLKSVSMSNVNRWRDGGVGESHGRPCGRRLREESSPAPFPCTLATEKTLEDADDALSFIALLPRG